MFSTKFFVRRAERLRAVSRLRGILEDESKTATYKFALLRAVADVNIEAPGRARFLARNEWQPTPESEVDWVAIPFSLIVERWLDYFWALTAGEGPAPRQIQGSRPLGFGASLSRLRRPVTCISSIARPSGASAKSTTMSPLTLTLCNRVS